jgi:hypothetical protein
MPSLDDFDIDLTDNEEVLDTFRTVSRQVFYMTLFENEALDISWFEEEEEGTVGEEEGEEETAKPLRSFSHYLFQKMGEDFLPPEDLSVDEWVELAEEVMAQLEPKMNLPALAGKVYNLLKQEVRIERERQIQHKAW